MQFLKIAKDVLNNEINNLKLVEKCYDKNFEKCVGMVLNCKGRILVSGLGKSGLIGRKVAATFSSIGVPSFFIHPVEAVHGDLGSFEEDDILIALSCSGDTKEVSDVVNFCKKHKIKTLGITCKNKSFLQKNCDNCLVLSMESEAIQGFPIPTTSCVMMLSICDAITACVVKSKKLSEEQYVQFHSGGVIGKTIKKIVKLKNKK